MAYYACVGSQGTLTTTFKTASAIWCIAGAGTSAATSRKIKIYEVISGAGQSPNSVDCSVVSDVSRQTASGSGAGTAGIFSPLDPTEAVATSTGLTNLSAETTIGVSLWEAGMNQRATVRWIAAQESQYMIGTLTSGLGFVGRALSPTFTASWMLQLTFQE